MGSAGGFRSAAPLLGLDAMVFVHFLEADERLGVPAKELFAAAEEKRCQFVASVVALLEVLVLPKREGREDLCSLYRELFQSFPNLTVMDVGPELAERASDLRAEYGIRTPDALHVATALQAGAEAFVSEERRLRKLRAIRVLTIAEVLKDLRGGAAGEVNEPRIRYGGRRAAPRRRLRRAS